MVKLLPVPKVAKCPRLIFKMKEFRYAAIRRGKTISIEEKSKIVNWGLDWTHNITPPPLKVRSGRPSKTSMPHVWPEAKEVPSLEKSPLVSER
jgi:hypothetical protein